MAAVSSATGGAVLWGYFFVHGQVISAYASMQQLFVFMFICAAVSFSFCFPRGFLAAKNPVLVRFRVTSLRHQLSNPPRPSPPTQDPHNDALIWRSYILPSTYQSRPT